VDYRPYFIASTVRGRTGEHIVAPPPANAAAKRKRKTADGAKTPHYPAAGHCVLSTGSGGGAKNTRVLRDVSSDGLEDSRNSAALHWRRMKHTTTPRCVEFCRFTTRTRPFSASTHTKYAACVFTTARRGRESDAAARSTKGETTRIRLSTYLVMWRYIIIAAPAIVLFGRDSVLRFLLNRQLSGGLRCALVDRRRTFAFMPGCSPAVSARGMRGENLTFC